MDGQGEVFLLQRVDVCRDGRRCLSPLAQLFHRLAAAARAARLDLPSPDKARGNKLVCSPTQAHAADCAATSSSPIKVQPGRRAFVAAMSRPLALTQPCPHDESVAFLPVDDRLRQQNACSEAARFQSSLTCGRTSSVFITAV